MGYKLPKPKLPDNNVPLAMPKAAPKPSVKPKKSQGRKPKEA